MADNRVVWSGPLSSQPLGIMMTESSSPGERRIGSVIFLAAGMYFIAIAADLIEVEKSTILAPRWVLFLFGLLFVTGGFMVLADQKSRTLDLLAGVFVASLGGMAAWAALASSSELHSGGFVFLSADANVSIARICFGMSALMCFAIAAFVARRGLRHDA